ncbi:adenine-specific methyltransferase EcoRI family protein [Candidatus Saccharibacteria bacterium]|nr:adenine-specific methyltransferase EcoRI family protein [Candidatus Saccharibacteria bacterium]
MAISKFANAQRKKNDEFYTQLNDINEELKHYKKHFEGKIVFCNCDDPFESNFFRYFALNFNKLKLKKLICTCYAGSPILQTELKVLPLFGKNGEYEKLPYLIEITEVQDLNGDGATDLSDIELLLKSDKNVLSALDGDGDFRSEESIAFLKEADIVVTNPPFSLFREYVAQLMEYEKKFLILSNINAITYKEIFPLIKNNKIWSGYGFNMSMIYKTPYPNLLEANRQFVIAHGKNPDDGFVKVPAICWFTNLDIEKRHEKVDLIKKYSEEDYPKYDNYDAIDVSKIADIPYDYDGYMGVPITFLNKYNPEQFEIIGLLQSSTDEEAGIPNLRYYNDFKEMRQDMTYTGASGGKANGNPVVKGKSEKGNFLFNENTNEYVHSVYARILIRRKKNEN